MHIANNHRGLMPDQVQELRQVKNRIGDMLAKTEHDFATKSFENYDWIVEQFHSMRYLECQCNEEQIRRIGVDVTSKTRLSILFYALVGNCILIAKQSVKLMQVFNESFLFDKKLPKSYIDLERRYQPEDVSDGKDRDIPDPGPRVPDKKTSS
jgi:hypothetical protein